MMEPKPATQCRSFGARWPHSPLRIVSAEKLCEVNVPMSFRRERTEWPRGWFI